MSTFTQLICLVEESQIGGLVWSRPEFNWLQRVYLQQNISLKLRNLSRKSAALIAILLRIPIQFGLKDDEFSLPVNKLGLKNHMHFRSGWTFYLVCKFIVLSCRFINNIPVNIFSLRHCCWGWNLLKLNSFKILIKGYILAPSLKFFIFHTDFKRQTNLHALDTGPHKIILY